MTNLEIFKATFRESLRESYSKRPQMYAWSITDIDRILQNFNKAIEIKGFDKNGPSAKATFKKLGIKNTWAAFDAYINQSTSKGK
jgi:hypothetical protein